MIVEIYQSGRKPSNVPRGMSISLSPPPPPSSLSLCFCPPSLSPSLCHAHGQRATHPDRDTQEYTETDRHSASVKTLRGHDNLQFPPVFSPFRTTNGRKAPAPLSGEQTKGACFKCVPYTNGVIAQNGRKKQQTTGYAAIGPSFLSSQ